MCDLWKQYKTYMINICCKNLIYKVAVRFIVERHRWPYLFSIENQYTQDNIDTTQRNHLYRIEIEDRFGLKKKFPHLLIEIVNKQNKKKTYILRNKDVAQERLKQLKQSEE